MSRTNQWCRIVGLLADKSHSCHVQMVDFMVEGNSLDPQNPFIWKRIAFTKKKLDIMLTHNSELASRNYEK